MTTKTTEQIRDELADTFVFKKYEGLDEYSFIEALRCFKDGFDAAVEHLKDSDYQERCRTQSKINNLETEIFENKNEIHQLKSDLKIAVDAFRAAASKEAKDYSSQDCIDGAIEVLSKIKNEGV